MPTENRKPQPIWLPIKKNDHIPRSTDIASLHNWIEDLEACVNRLHEENTVMRTQIKMIREATFSIPV